MSLHACLLLLSALAAFAGVNAQIQCGKDSQGTFVGNPLPLPDQFMAAGVQDFTYPIPQMCSPNGVVAKACDGDRVPLVKINGLDTVFVRRMGALNSVAKLSVTLYCAPMRRSAP